MLDGTTFESEDLSVGFDNLLDTNTKKTVHCDDVKIMLSGRYILVLRSLKYSLASILNTTTVPHPNQTP